MADTDYTALAVDITGLTVPLHACRYYGLQPDIKVIAPWREWDLNSRSNLISYAEKNNIPVPASKRGEPPFSMDANLLHISYEGYAIACKLCAYLETLHGMTAMRSALVEHAAKQPEYSSFLVPLLLHANHTSTVEGTAWLELAP
jgi:hypothetical protein